MGSLLLAVIYLIFISLGLPDSLLGPAGLRCRWRFRCRRHTQDMYP